MLFSFPLAVLAMMLFPSLATEPLSLSTGRQVSPCCDYIPYAGVSWAFDLEAKSELITVDSFKVFPGNSGTLEVYIRNAAPSRAHGHLEVEGDWVKIFEQDMSFNGYEQEVSLPENAILIPPGESRAVLLYYTGVQFSFANPVASSLEPLPLNIQDDKLKVSHMIGHWGATPFGDYFPPNRPFQTIENFGVNYHAHPANINVCDQFSPCFSAKGGTLLAVCNPSSDGTFTCTCPGALVGTGLRVGDEPTCIWPCVASSCHPDATCSVHDNEVFCECNAGFRGDGEHCERVSTEELCSSNPDPNRFNVCIDATEPDFALANGSWIDALVEAKERLESIITEAVYSAEPVRHVDHYGGRPDWEIDRIPYDRVPSKIYGTYIVATLEDIDGEYGTLGLAAPAYRRCGCEDGKPCESNYFALPYTGYMYFDRADIERMMAQGTFSATLLHELMHILGFGTLWRVFGLRTLVADNRYSYTGERACEEWAELSGCAGTCPDIEEEGGGGTRGLHWNEYFNDTHGYDFGDELMTGWADLAQPLSRITLAALEDLGYEGIDYSQVDQFEPPTCRRLLRFNGESPKSTPRVLHEPDFHAHSIAREQALEQARVEMARVKCGSSPTVFRAIADVDVTVIGLDGMEHSYGVSACEIKCHDSDEYFNDCWYPAAFRQEHADPLAGEIVLEEEETD